MCGLNFYGSDVNLNLKDEGVDEERKERGCKAHDWKDPDSNPVSATNCCRKYTIKSDSYLIKPKKNLAT